MLDPVTSPTLLGDHSTFEEPHVAWREKHGAIQVNHMVVKASLLPHVVTEVYRMLELFDDVTRRLR